MENTSEEPTAVTVHCHERLHELINGGSLDFCAWKALITEIEKIHPDDIDIISTAYDSLLSRFPLCHWYWQRYAYHQARLCNANAAVEVFEQAIELTPFSVGLWYEYCHFAITYFDDQDNVRRLFQKGISIVGKDYYCHVLWDKYILFEYSQRKWAHLAKVYAQALRFPTQKLQKYYKIFKDHVTILEEEIQPLNNGNLEMHINFYLDPSALSDKEISQVVNDIWDSSDIRVRCKALHMYKFIGDQLYQKAFQLDVKIKRFESKIHRRYFDASPLDDDQLNNWHQYLDFIEKQDDFDWAVKLYERCLITCASYPEFWMRYVDFMEAKGGRELAMFAIERATKVFLNNIPGIHLFSARYMEHIQDLDGARANFFKYDTNCGVDFVESVINQANMERRLGNQKAACEIYEKALRLATSEKGKQVFLPKLYINYYHLKHMMKNDIDASRDVLIKGIQQVPNCKILYEELIRFAMIHGVKQLSFIEPVITSAISSSSDQFQGLDSKDREYISTLFLEYVDLCGTVNDVRKAWNLHIRLFPQLIRTSPFFNEHQSSKSFLLHPSENGSSGQIIQQPEKEMLTLPPSIDDKQPTSVESKTDASEQLELTNDSGQMNTSESPEPLQEFEKHLQKDSTVELETQHTMQSRQQGWPTHHDQGYYQMWQHHYQQQYQYQHFQMQHMQPYNQYQMDLQTYQHHLQLWQQYQQTVQQEQVGGYEYPFGQQHQELELLDQGQMVTQQSDAPHESQSEQVLVQSKIADACTHGT